MQTKKPSGIVGNKVPPSVRPDGTIRKEIKIRPGYLPVEDAVKFQSSRTLELKNMIVGSSKSREGPEDISKSSLKNKKRKDKKKQSETAGETLDTDTHTAQGLAVNDDQPALVDPAVENEKKKRALLKKLRQIQELQVKLDSGAELTPEQRDKLNSRDEIQKMLDLLE